MPTLTDLLNRLWEDYAAFTPQAHAVHHLLDQRGETVVNDHIALRTFDDPRIGLEALAGAFISHGYRPRGAYEFPEKKLVARHYEHGQAEMPKVFISELKLQACSGALRGVVRDLVDQAPADLAKRWDFPTSGRPWRLSFDTYRKLAAESEYAAWVAAFGFRANHFTVLVNRLKTFRDLAALNAFLKQAGFRLNTSGGEIKGSPDVLLEQSSTLADQVDMPFSDGTQRIGGCYYEFARRYPLPDGSLFQGFVAQSANRIFESTNRR